MVRYLHHSILAIGLLTAAACATSKESGEDGEQRPGRPVSQPAPERHPELNLAAPSDEVRTIQLFAGEDERRLPVIPLRSDEVLTLAFDLMAPTGRPLSAYFYHADRTWRRDLVPAEYMGSFYQDNVFNYSSSRGTAVRYTHYVYRFPNDAVQFLISGNYILRITEQGREDAVLFERPFFITEQSTPVEMTTERLMVGGGSSHPFTVPMVRFVPPSAFQGNVYDFDVCFVRNGRFDMIRCSGSPSLIMQPQLQFYLEPEQSFEPATAAYYIDLGQLRAGRKIEEGDFSTTPYRIRLQPDHARFPGDGLAPRLDGQPVVAAAVRDVGDSAHAAEYVEVAFRFVPPDEQPLDGELILTGSFNGWRYDRANQLVWVAERGWYEGHVLLKQGAYEYRYFSPDGRLRRMMREAPPASENLYAAFVYYKDLHLSTDRLVSVSTTRAR
jgi:hypothetical protein